MFLSLLLLLLNRNRSFQSDSIKPVIPKVIQNEYTVLIGQFIYFLDEILSVNGTGCGALNRITSEFESLWRCQFLDHLKKEENKKEKNASAGATETTSALASVPSLWHHCTCLRFSLLSMSCPDAAYPSAFPSLCARLPTLTPTPLPASRRVSPCAKTRRQVKPEPSVCSYRQHLSFGHKFY